MKNLKGKVAAITGVGSGIGEALAMNLAKQGCDLSLNEINTDRLKSTIENVRTSIPPLKYTAMLLMLLMKRLCGRLLLIP